MRTIHGFILCVGLGTLAVRHGTGEELHRFNFSARIMGTPAEAVLYAPDPELASKGWAAVRQRWQEIEMALSDYRPDSEARKLSRAEAIGTRHAVSHDLAAMLGIAEDWHARSHGALDVTMGSLTRLWRQARRCQRLPDGEQIDAVRRASGWDKIQFDRQARSVQIESPQLRLDFGAIGKGYAADQGLACLREMGMPRALVKLGGDLAAGEGPPDSPGWRIAVSPAGWDRPPIRYVRLINRGITTSGDASRGFTLNGTRYSHIIDPRTGWPVRDGWAATVIAATAAEADALATVLCLLGPDTGLPWLQDVSPSAQAMLYREHGETVEIRSTTRFDGEPEAGESTPEDPTCTQPTER